MINSIYNIVQLQNSKVVEERFLRLEESIQHAQPRANLVQEVVSWENRFDHPESLIAN